MEQPGEKEKFDQWCILEIFGHQTYAGRVTEQTIGGCSFIRIDIPKTGELESFTKLFGQAAIYAMTIVDEETAKMKAASLGKYPIEVWELKSLVENVIKNRSTDNAKSLLKQVKQLNEAEDVKLSLENAIKSMVMVTESCGDDTPF